MTETAVQRFQINGILALILVLLGFLYWEVGLGLVDSWQEYEEYSHGYFLPIIAGYLFWQRKELIENSNSFTPCWWGTVIALIALVLFFIGMASHTVYAERISLILLLAGLSVARFGFPVIPIIFVPLLLIFLSYPLPFFINAELTSGMQLISSELGVIVIRLFDIPVYLEGNIIDLGTYKLQVVEACSGLRYMYPLLSLSLILAFFFRVVMWKRVLVFVSAIPITIVMNSVRIGIIGVLVEYFGIEVAEGFLHDFEGWVIFLVCFFFLYLEMWLITARERKTVPFSNLLVVK